jgi:hypothetical protein
MANQQVVDYVRSNLSNGVRLEDIESSLRQSGWPEAEIAAGVAEVQGPAQPGPPSAPYVPGTQQPEVKKKGHKKLIVAIIVLIILVILFVHTIFSLLSEFEVFLSGGSNLPADIPFVS